MDTLTQAPPELDPRTLRFAALLAIGTGMTAGRIRSRSAGTDREAADKQLADEIDYLTAHGVTERVASRVFRERDRRNPAYANYVYTYIGLDAREAAMIYLAGGLTPARLRERTALRSTREDRRMCAMIAGQMDALLAEGFDAAVYAKEIDQACGGAR